jgi:endo-1,4-beta-xylanase
MKKLFPFFGLLFITLFLNATEIPPGGTNMIDDAIYNFTRIGNAGTINVVDVEHDNFSKALEVNVTAQTDNYWNFQLVFKTNMALEEGDVCLVSFWARTTKSPSESGEGLLTAIIEHNETYAKPLSKTFSPGGEWVHFVYGFQSNMTLPADKHKAAFFLGYGIQNIQVADVQFLNYKNTLTVDDLPVMEVRYAGMEPDAAWRTEAATRIEKFRKGNVTVKLVDAQNNPVAGAQISLKMKQHKFGFGTAIDGNLYLSNSTYRRHIHELFNEVVFENDLKWRPWVTRGSHNYILQAIDSLSARNFKVRGHTIIWPGWQYLPDYLKLYQNNPARLKLECENRIDEVVTFTKGRLVDWDVINEAYTNRDLQNAIGNEVMAEWFNRVKEIDPDVKKYINDYSILGNGGVNVNHQNGYFDIIQYIENQGGEIDGIGMQGHFAELVTGIPKVFEILDRFSVFNKEIKITEFDINSTNDELKVNYTRDFMTALFSHPFVKSILCWGFWEGRHWKPEAAHYNLDWSIRPQGEMFKQLLFEDWWTPDQTLNSDAAGNVEFGSCFLGTYEVEIEYNGQTILKSVPVHFNLENEIIVNVDDFSIVAEGTQHEDTPIFTSAEKFIGKGNGEMKIYPNPASTEINLNLGSAQNRNYNARLTDIAGKTVLNLRINPFFDKKISLPNLNAGVYFFSLESDNQRFIEKLIVTGQN